MGGMYAVWYEHWVGLSNEALDRKCRRAPTRATTVALAAVIV